MTMRIRYCDPNLRNLEGSRNGTRLWMETTIRLMPLLFVMVLVACASMPPAQEMSDARQAIHAAREAHAERHASEYLDQAETFLEQAARDLEHGEYERARRNATAAKAAAVVARDHALATAQ